MATTNSVTSSNTSILTTLSPFNITTNSTISFYPQNNLPSYIPPVSFIIPPVSSSLPTTQENFIGEDNNLLQTQNPSLLLPNIFINNSTCQLQQQQLINASETLPGLLASFLLNSAQQQQSSLLCGLSASSLLSQQQQLIELLKQQNQQSSLPISQFHAMDFSSSAQQKTSNGIQAFEAATLTNYQKLCKNSVIKPQLSPPTSQINGVGALNIPPNFSNQNSLEQQLLVLLNLQQKPQNTEQNGSKSTVANGLGKRENSTNINEIQHSTQQNSLDSLHFKDDKEYKNCPIRRSSSSVSYYKTCSSNADVSEHFKRTFSGKWPKKLPSTSLRSSYIGRGGGGGNTIISKTNISNKEGVSIEEGREIDDISNLLNDKNEGEKREENSFLSIKMEKRPSSAFKNEEEIFQKILMSGTNCQLRQKVGYTLIRRVNLTSEDKQVEEHFRKSLGDDNFKRLRSNQEGNNKKEES